MLRSICSIVIPITTHSDRVQIAITDNGLRRLAVAAIEQRDRRSVPYVAVLVRQIGDDRVNGGLCVGARGFAHFRQDSRAAARIA